MTMQRRHFELIAESIRTWYVPFCKPEDKEALRARLANHFASSLRATNLQFNRDRFLRACGVED